GDEAEALRSTKRQQDQTEAGGEGFSRRRPIPTQENQEQQRTGQRRHQDKVDHDAPQERVLKVAEFQKRQGEEDVGVTRRAPELARHEDHGEGQGGQEEEVDEKDELEVTGEFDERHVNDLYERDVQPILRVAPEPGKAKGSLPGDGGNVAPLVVVGNVAAVPARVR